ncbi:MAG: tetratricopeptide repeat protein [Candidatus Hydrogenedentota bacterium]
MKKIYTLCLLILVSCTPPKIYTARHHFKNQDFDKSFNDYNSILKNRLAYPTRFQAEIGLIWSAYNKNDYKKVIEEINKVRIDFKSTIPEDWLLVIEAFSYFHLNNYSYTVTIADKLINKYPDSYFVEDAYYLKGRANEELKKYEEAELAYERFLKIYSSPLYLKDVLFGYYSSLYALKKYERAIQILLTYLEYFKEEKEKNIEYIYDLGYMSSELGRFIEAVNYYEEYLRANGQFHKYEIIYYLAKYYADTDEEDKAARYFNTILKDITDFSEEDYIHLWLGTHYLRKDKKNLAMQHFKTLFLKGLNCNYFEDALFFIPQIEELQGEYNEAILDYARYLTYFPKGKFADTVNRKITDLSLKNVENKKSP